MRRSQKCAIAKVQQLLGRAEGSGESVLAQALRQWKKLKQSHRKRICHELVLTRGDELRRAYHSIVSVEAGLRTTRNEAGARVETNEPAVVFYVHRKWKQPPKTEQTEMKRLPEYLWVFSADPTTGGRILCAAPTDVCQLAAGARPEDRRPPAGKLSWVLSRGDPLGSNSYTKGVVTCAVRIRGEPERTYALSCLHVLGRTKLRGSGRTAAPPIRVELASDAKRIGYTDVGRWVGELRRSNVVASFDAALARVDRQDFATLRLALGQTRFDSYLAYGEIPPFHALILTAQNGDVPVRDARLRTNFNRIKYLKGGRQPFHRRLYAWRLSTAKTTSAGDSGSPVVTRDRSTLLGMHIARNREAGLTFMIPAELLFAGASYGQTGSLRPLRSV